MKRILCIFLLVLIIIPTCTVAFAYEMQPIVRERDMHDLFTTETFKMPDDLEFGTLLEDVIEWLPLSETMTPGNEAFDARKYKELPQNGFYNLVPFLRYSFPETEEMELVMEFNDKKEFYGFWLVSDAFPVAGFGDEEKAAVPQLLLACSKIFEERSEPLIADGPQNLNELTWSYFEEGGQLRVFYLSTSYTFCQMCANINDGNFSFRFGIGDSREWPGIDEAIIESADAYAKSRGIK